MKLLAMRAMIFLVVMLYGLTAHAYKPVEFSQEDRDRILRIETTLQVFMEQVDKRFEQVDKRFEQLTNFLWMLVSIFTAFTIAILGFAIWDRKTIVSKAKEEAIKAIQSESKVETMLKAMRKISETDPKWKTVLSELNLL